MDNDCLCYLHLVGFACSFIVSDLKHFELDESDYEYMGIMLRISLKKLVFDIIN